MLTLRERCAELGFARLVSFGTLGAVSLMGHRRNDGKNACLVLVVNIKVALEMGSDGIVMHGLVDHRGEFAEELGPRLRAYMSKA